jgi:HEAT repeat protein
MPTRRIAVALLAACAALPGCQTDGPTAAAPAQPRSGTPAGGATAPAPLSAVTQSQIRERALGVVDSSATSADAGVRANAVEAAALAANRLDAVIARALSDPSPAVRSVAAMAVGRGNLKDLADRVEVMLADPTPHVKASAIFALVKTGRPVDRTPLATFLLEDSSPWVRRHAAFLLGELGDRSALSLLRSAAVDPFPQATREQVKNLQLQITEAMAKLGDDKARQSLRAQLYPSRPEDLETAVLAVQILGQIRDREVQPQLIQMAQYKDRAGTPYPPEIRLAVAGALASLDDPSFAYVAEEFVGSPQPLLRAQAAFVLGEVGGRDGWTQLDRLLQDPEPAVRIAAAAAVLKSSGRR